MKSLLLWHQLPAYERDMAFNEYKKVHNLTDEQVLLEWKTLLAQTFAISSQDIEYLKTLFSRASKNRAQPSLHYYSQLSSEKQQLVNILHILYAQDRQHALLSPRFDYLTLNYLSQL